MMSFGKIAKAIVAIVGLAATTINAAVSDEEITNSEWIGLAIALVVAYGVWQTPNAKQPVSGGTLPPAAPRGPDGFL
jgi:hypothetical protein